MTADASGGGLRPGVGLRRVGVLVPVQDEEELLPRCLGGLALAAARLVEAAPQVRLHVVVVLDGCTDGSEQAVHRAPWPADVHPPQVLHVHPSLGVGAARAAGAGRLLAVAAADEVAPERVWLAGTDADSVVPPGWLLDQVAAAAAGWVARVGTVELPDDHPVGSARALLAAAWTSRQRHEEDHDHVYGANLGVRGDAYLAAGGYPPLRAGEDAALVAALTVLGLPLLRTAAHPVRTSDRRSGRVADGVSVDLALLAGPARRPGPQERAATDARTG